MRAPVGHPPGLEMCSSGSGSSAPLMPKGTCFLLSGRPGGAGQGRENEGRVPFSPTESKIPLGIQGRDKYREFLWELSDFFNLVFE